MAGVLPSPALPLPDAPRAELAHRLRRLSLAQQRGRELWRVKGLVRCRGQPGTLVVQGVGGWIELERDPRPAEESLLVVIGRGLDGAELQRGFAACAAP